MQHVSLLVNSLNLVDKIRRQPALILFLPLNDSSIADKLLRMVRHSFNILDNQMVMGLSFSFDDLLGHSIHARLPIIHQHVMIRILIYGAVELICGMFWMTELQNIASAL